MDQLKNFADSRLIQGCIYCGAPAETREHVPSKTFLDAPLPENLPIVEACLACNAGFSRDEEYVACFIEAAYGGTTDPDQIERPSIARKLCNAPALRARIEASKISLDGGIAWKPEGDRLRNVIVKLARGHAAFELSQPCRDDPVSVWWGVLDLMPPDQREAFEDAQIIEQFAEVGSRGNQRLLVLQASMVSTTTGEEIVTGLIVNDWVEVQQDLYRYHAIDQTDTVIIRFIIREYLACEVCWQR